MLISLLPVIAYGVTCIDQEQGSFASAYAEASIGSADTYACGEGVARLIYGFAVEDLVYVEIYVRRDNPSVPWEDTYAKGLLMARP